MNPTPAILITLASACIGFALGYIFFTLTSRREPESQPASEKQALPEPAVAPPLPAPPPDPGISEVARLWFDRSDQKLVVGIGSQVIRTPEALSLEDRQRLESAAGQLSTWFSPLQVEAPGPAHIPIPEPAPAVKKASYSLNPVNVVMNAVEADMKKLPDETDQSIALQVNKILQEKLIGTPLEKRGVALSETRDHDLVVRIGLEKFTGLDAVPDEEIKTIIREAVQEWEATRLAAAQERRQKPG